MLAYCLCLIPTSRLWKRVETPPKLFGDRQLKLAISELNVNRLLIIGVLVAQVDALRTKKETHQSTTNKQDT